MKKPKEPRGTMTFSCGGTIAGCEDPTHVSSHVKNGRCRLVVFDTEGGLTRPWLNGTEAPCLFECPCKLAGGRKAWKGYPSDEKDTERRMDAGERMGVGGISWRRWVTCYGKWEQK